MLNKNPEVARLQLRLLAAAALFILLACGLAVYSLQTLQQSMALHHAAMVGAAVAGLDPEAERALIRQLQTPDGEAAVRGQEVLAQYGLQPDRLMTDTRMLSRQLGLELALFTALALLMAGAFYLLIRRFLHQQYRRLQELTQYAEQVAGGDYSMDIRDNDEGQLSILRNEIYTITTMLREQAEALQRDKTRLAASIADISHQLKTPLTSLSVLNELLQERPDEALQAEFLERMRAQLNRMEWLIASLLKLSRLDAGTVELKREACEAGSLIQKALATLQIPIEIKQLEIQTEGALNADLICDRNWTGEALINMIKNGIEHTPEQGRIRITAEDNPLYTRITVSDSGEGIARKDLPYIFNRFYRGANARDDSVGIGLAMAYTIMRKQGGDIGVRSEPGCGTAFDLTFFKSAAPESK